MSTAKTLLTAEDLFAMDTDQRYELVKGELVDMPPSPGSLHGNVASRILGFLLIHGEFKGLGKTFGAETGFRIERNPDTVRAADAAFVARDRLPPGKLPEGYLDLTPDIVVEVVSPSDTRKRVQAKVADWLRTGARLVLVFYPRTETVMVYRSLTDVKILTLEDVLGGAPVLPGFSVPVKELF